MQLIPDNCHAYKRTSLFTESTVPAGLLKAHQTKAGTWGKIVVVKGKVLYRILEPDLEEHLLDTNHFGVVEPGIPHEIEPIGEVSFYVDFYKIHQSKP